MYKLMIIIGCDTSKKAWKFQITFEKKKWIYVRFYEKMTYFFIVPSQFYLIIASRLFSHVFESFLFRNCV